MRNRAKCKLCNSIIESFHPTDIVECKCGEIAVYEGNALRCAARDFNNFIRLDDKDQEIQVKILDEKVQEEEKKEPTRDELLEIFGNYIKSIENLPPQAMQSYVSHYDLWTALAMVYAILKK